MTKYGKGMMQALGSSPTRATHAKNATTSRAFTFLHEQVHQMPRDNLVFIGVREASTTHAIDDDGDDDDGEEDLDQMGEEDD
ncbi:hypothetical protein RJT34_07652 [Clitoria ternatea]|uniref:Uncharacterized protein n=1 Tax=Clitoria ternatea TaxID=43366 RepID=A0AAN9K4P1_CLITE